MRTGRPQTSTARTSPTANGSSAPTTPATLTSRNNLANALSDLGDYQQAADLPRETLADRERVLGPDHPDTLTSRNDLANTCARLAGAGRRWWQLPRRR
ncbi:tetratricopeptide repeat protein [Streptomyces griseus]|uniref:tetratricopeptide repeat protein n=1 Tax=Streptomyces griseus TaxID=1911 RepID=UPI0037D40F98